MIKCECGKEYKTQRGLTAHKKKCVKEDSEEIKKLKIRYKNTYDASTRHYIQLEIEKLQGK